MLKQLSEDDAQAVDIVLEREVDGVQPAHVVNLAERVEAAEKLLSLLGTLPDEDLPGDLLASTMRRIGEQARPGSGRELGDALDLRGPVV